MITNKDCTLEEIQYHRNGVGGNGFYVMTFQWDRGEDCAPRILPMIATIFPEHDSSGDLANTFWGNIAVFRRDLIGQGNIEFGVNSWRGDRFELWCRDQVLSFSRKTTMEMLTLPTPGVKDD